ncbi:50S ribosomal protein L17 [bacterium TMED181]|nr:50S ribosomal protein L17 [Planctomycetota bacterium]OUW42884.1 MAG: 50S ribosomal protein L17 [bacterium TMED181]
MRHRVAGKKLNRNSSHRKALSRNLMRAMIIEWQGKGHIVTTRAKAKFIQPKIEKMITLSKEKTVHNIRRAMAELCDRKVVQLLFDEIGPYYQQRPGGYTRILRLVKPRLGDASVRAYLGFVREDDEYPEGDRRAKSSEGAVEVTEAPVAEVSEPVAEESGSESTESEGSPTEASAEESEGDQQAEDTAEEGGESSEEAPKS